MSCPEMADSTVIIVEDEMSVRESQETLLSAADYHYTSLASGEAFLGEPLPSIPRCLLLDLRLNGHDGLEVQDELNARHAELPVLILSGADSVSAAVSAMKAGAMDFLQKPVQPELLLSHIERAMKASVEARDRHASAEHDALLLARLTQREHEILALLV